MKIGSFLEPQNHPEGKPTRQGLLRTFSPSLEDAHQRASPVQISVDGGRIGRVGNSDEVCLAWDLEVV